METFPTGQGKTEPDPSVQIHGKPASLDSAEYQLIEQDRQLAELVRHLFREPVIAVDLEADSMHHFQEKVCLLQLSTGRRHAIVDPLAVGNMQALAPVFAASHICKIFHGGDYDIRSLYRDFQMDVNGLFDTQIACQFLGVNSTGLEAVLKARFDISLDKRFQRRDWSRRPLPVEMLDYAIKDVLYLIPLARQLEAELEKVGRKSWVAEECQLLSEVRPAEPNGEPLFLRFRGAGRLAGRQLAVLEALLQLRLKIAAHKDRPPFKVFGNQVLMKLVQACPEDLQQLTASGALSKKQIKMYAPELLEAIQNAMAIHESALPVYPRKKTPRLSAKVPQRIKALKTWRDRNAQKLSMEPGLLMNKAAIAELARVMPRREQDLDAVKGLKNWQRRFLGGKILATLRDCA